MLTHCFKIRQTLAIFTKFQTIIPKEEVKILIFIMHYLLCKIAEFSEIDFALGHQVIETLLSPVVKTIL